MPVRNTSKAAFLENEESGLHATKRLQVYMFIKLNPGCSRADIVRGVRDMTVNCATGRVNELIKMELVHESGCKKDSVTQHSVNCLYKGIKEEESASVLDTSFQLS